MNYQLILQSVDDWLQRTMAWFASSTSAMDLHTAVICAAVFVISALVVYLISVFGMRERTYEEAIEEQRRRNQEAIQQAKTDKNKKDKKFKKWGKKTKEKVEEERSASCDAESKTSEEVEVKADLDLNSAATNQNSDSKAPSLKKKVRQRKPAILEKGDECSQHFSSSEETDEPPSVSSSLGSAQTPEEEKKVILDKDSRLKEEFKIQSLEASVDFQEEMKEKNDDVLVIKPLKKSPSKKNKKNKSDSSDLCSEFSEWNESKILSIVKSITLSEDEVQHILDALNSKYKGLSSDRKKNDVSNLKKLLQEKDDVLKAEQKLCLSANEKINELLQELDEQKAQSSGTEKSLRDALNQEQQEIKALHGMMQRKREQYASEIASLQSKMQQMKNKMKEEHTLALQRLQEENNQLQSLNRIESEKSQRSSLEISRLQHEIEQLRSSREKFETHQAAMQQNQEDLHHQIQQLEKHIEQLVSSHQEEEYSYKQRINEMSNKIQQTENARSSLVQELQNAQSVCSSLEADNSSLRQRLEDAKHQLSSSEQDIMQLQNRLEETTRQQRDLANCLEKMRDEVVDLSNIKHEQLQVIQSLKQENEALASQIAQNMERMAADGSDQKQQNGELSETQSRLIDLEDHEAVVQEKENMLHRLLQELDQCKCEIMSLSNDLECQKKRNKEFVDKNSDLVEALNTAENKLQDVIKSAEKRVQEAQIKADNCSKEMQNILNEQIKEVEHALQENYSRELQNVRQEAESIKKEAEERILKAETQANLRLEEFQESLYERLSELNNESEAKVKEALNEKEEVKHQFESFILALKDFLLRTFPSLNVPGNFDSKVLLSQYEMEVKSYLLQLKGDSNHESKDIEDMMQKLNETMEEKINLESQLKNYSSVLAETEKILKSLQNNIETEEKKWKKELQCKDETLKGMLSENENLKLQNKNLQTNLEQLQGLKEMEAKLIELQSRLQNEEAEKITLRQRFNEDSLTNSSSISVSDNNFMQIPEVNSNILPTKSQKRKKSRKRGASGKK